MTKVVQCATDGSLQEVDITSGSGTVTSVGATNSNGVTFTVSNPTTTPNISIAIATQSAGDNTTNAATTAFVTTAIANGIATVNAATSAEAATAAILPNSPTYNNGVSGVGATITSGTNSVLTIDTSYTPALNDDILVKNEGDASGLGAAKNGLYYVFQLGVAGVTPWILKRKLDYDQASDINETGAIAIKNNGTANKNTSWLLQTLITTVGTDAITYRSFTIDATTIITNSTSAGGDLTGTYPNPTIATSAVTNAKQANMAANTVKMNNTNASAAPSDVALSASQFIGRAATGNAGAQTFGSSFGNVVGTTTLDVQTLRTAKTSNYTITTTDIGALMQFTGSSDITFSFTAAATLGNGWWVLVENAGTSNATATLDPNGSETIDGRTTFKMYPGELRLVQCNGTNFISRVLKPFNFTTTATITFTPPPGYTGYDVTLQAGGGAGASRSTTGNVSGGGGGASFRELIPASFFSTSGETVTIGASVNGQTGNASGSAGNNTSITASSGPGSPTYTAKGGAGGTGGATGSNSGQIVGGYPSSPFDLSVQSFAASPNLWPLYGWSSSLPGGGTTLVNSGINSAGGGYSNSSNVNIAGGNSLNGGAGGGSASSSTASGSSGGTAYFLNATGGNGSNSTGSGATSGGTGCGGGGAVQGGTSGGGGAGQCQIIGVC